MCRCGLAVLLEVGPVERMLEGQVMDMAEYAVRYLPVELDLWDKINGIRVVRSRIEL